jgi:hypothetical protein
LAGSGSAAVKARKRSKKPDQSNSGSSMWRQSAM